MTSIENTIEFLENHDNLYEGEIYSMIYEPSSTILVEALKERKESGKINEKLIEELKTWRKSSWNDNLMWLYTIFMGEKGENFDFVFDVDTIIKYLE